MPLLSEDESWMRDGACWDSPEQVSLWFPGTGQSPVHAQRICHTCPVEQTCLMYAIENGIDHGVWGGTSERQRRRLRAEYVDIRERVAA